MVALALMADEAPVIVVVRETPRAETPAAQAEDRATLAASFVAARRGDSAAFEEIYRRFVRVVHGIAISRVGAQEAEDVTQEVFISVHRGLAGVRDVEALPGWICAIARNMSTDQLRRRARTPPRAPLEDVAAPRQLDRASEEELRERVLARIRGLPESYRETLILRLVEGLTGPEIADRTGLTHGSVRVNLTRGMALLRDELQKEGWS